MTLFHMVDSRIHNLIDNNPDTYVSNLTDRIVLFRQLSVLFNRLVFSIIESKSLLFSLPAKLFSFYVLEGTTEGKQCVRAHFNTHIFTLAQTHKNTYSTACTNTHARAYTHAQKHRLNGPCSGFLHFC